MNLGLDASTTTVGYAFTEDEEILDAGFFNIKDIEGNREKAAYVIGKLQENPLIEKVADINLEGSLSGFAGPSSRTVVVMLARWNAVFEYALEDHFKRKINLVGAQTARKKVLGAARLDGIKPKEFVKMKMDKLYDLSPWEIKNKKGEPDKRMEDVRDAVVIALWSKV
jgi:hypothetical protein